MAFKDFTNTKFDEILSENGWTDEKEDDLRIFINDDNYWEIWPGEESDTFEFLAYTEFFNYDYVIKYTVVNIEKILMAIVASQAHDDIKKITLDIVDLGAEVISPKYISEGDDVRIVKVSVTAANFDKLIAPEFKKIEKDDFCFYSAGLVESGIYIDKKDQDDAFKTLVTFINQSGEYENVNQERYSDINVLFNEYVETPSVRDDDGNIVNLEQGDEDWAIDFLDVIAEYIRKDSFVILQDDCNILWKIVYDGKKADYFMENI